MGVVVDWWTGDWPIGKLPGAPLAWGMVVLGRPVVAPMGVVEGRSGDWPTEVAPRLFNPLPAKGAVVVVVFAVLKFDMVSVLL
jgi:hypothetical protein